MTEEQALEVVRAVLRRPVSPWEQRLTRKAVQEIRARDVDARANYYASQSTGNVDEDNLRGLY